MWRLLCLLVQAAEPLFKCLSKRYQQHFHVLFGRYIHECFFIITNQIDLLVKPVLTQDFYNVSWYKLRNLYSNVCRRDITNMFMLYLGDTGMNAFFLSHKKADLFLTEIGSYLRLLLIVSWYKLLNLYSNVCQRDITTFSYLHECFFFLKANQIYL